MANEPPDTKENMATKSIHQLHDNAGQCTGPAVSAPGCFIQNHTQVNVQAYQDVVSGSAAIQWGDVFSSPRAGNDVKFFSTGDAYFREVAGAISAAKKTVFITGWQVNHDVELIPKSAGQGKTLFECLLDALKNGATVYVMPWLAPPGPIDTGHLMTLLAINLLNSAPGVKGKAYCLTAPTQSDQGTLSVVFSHHQKLVVIDNDRAFVGGIDLAYGRRDDGKFSLKADGRKLNEFYSPCIPPVHDLTNADVQHTVTMAELLAATFTRGAARSASTFLTSPSEGIVAAGLDALASIKQTVGDAIGWAADAWDNVSLWSDFTGAVQDAAADAAQNASRWAWDQLDQSIKDRLGKLKETGGANAASAASAVVAWLNGADLSRLPPHLVADTSKLIHAIAHGVMAGIHAGGANKPEHYPRLFEKIRSMPAGTQVHDVSTQPRMPWQDVHCSIRGPSVHDLSLNFVRRWNSAARVFERSFARFRNPLATSLLRSAGLRLPPTPKAPRIAPEHQPTVRCEPVGKCWVQVVRSASRQLQRDEAEAMGGKEAASLPQNNCLKAMLHVIAGSQKFLYIEGQFFQTAHGSAGPTSAVHSGPMGALLNLKRSPETARFEQMLGIQGVKPEEIPKKLRWAKIDDVLKEAKGPEFMQDLHTVLKNVATVEVMRALGKPQSALINPMGKALVNRIERAIDDGLPFHVYLVLPVHPEGTLDTLNIMSQVHLTMHSLVFGTHSLVNGVRRAILVDRYRRERKVSKQVAKDMVARLDVDKLEKQAGSSWQRYLTLLNLRNWDTLDGKPVTEQIYVHSKLLIADDRVAVLGSANINDRSLLGDRDSELAVVIRDDTPAMAKLDGKREEQVSAVVHQLRKDLWSKHFGGMAAEVRAGHLLSPGVLNSPAAEQTWTAIQRQSQANADAYDAAFWFLPRSGARPEVQAKDPRDKEEGPPPASLWPTWQYASYLDHAQGGRLLARMPFDPLFWRATQRGDVVHSWNVSKDAKDGRSPTKPPKDVLGFLVSLPIGWTRRENNLSIASHLGALAHNDRAAPANGKQVAINTGSRSNSEEMTG